MPHSWKKESWAVILLLVVVVLASSSLGAVAGQPTPYDPALPEEVGTEPVPDGVRVVRAYYDDPQMVRQMASWLEPWEVRPDGPAASSGGYVVVDVDAAGYDRLLAIGFRLEVDQELTAQINTPAVPLPGQTMSIPGYPCYRTVEETFDTAVALATAYPNLATWNDVGDSWERFTPGGNAGYDMGVLVLTNANVPGPKPKLFAMAAIHAREYTTAELVTRFAEYLVSNYDLDPDVTWLLDYHEIHLMLHGNPDGRKQAETGLSWRKNTNGNYCGSESQNRGADLNRNYPFQWGCCGGSSGSPCDELYRGASAGSEPETQAVVNYVASVFPDRRNDDLVSPAPDDTMGIFLDIHSYSELVLWPWGFQSSPPPNGTQLQTLGRKFAYFNGYTPQQSMQLYTTDGTTQDWAYGALGLPGYCFELGNYFFESCSAFEDTILPDNMDALLYAAKAARTPYLTPGGPDTLTVSVIPFVIEPGDPAAITATADDTRYYDNIGGEPTQNIAAAEYYIDVPPWVTTTMPVAYPMTAVDGAFDEKIEPVAATIDTTALSLGRHIIYVRAMDAGGRWGAVSAQFLYVLDPGVSPTIQGRVLDAISGQPLAATVTAGPFEAHTDPATGLYAMTVISDTYDLTATAMDHGLQTFEDVVAQDGQTVEQDFALDPICTVWQDDVESGTAGWTTTGQWGTTTLHAHSPTHSWADSPTGYYGNDWDYALTAPPIDLSGATGTTLVFWQQYDLEDNWDYGYVEYSTNGGANWTTAATINGENTLPDWEMKTIELPALDGLASARIRFRIDTDGSQTRDGWFLDDFVIRATGAMCGAPQAPAAAFTNPSSVLLGDPVPFTNMTTGTPPMSYLWTFGDGGSSTEGDPVYTYAELGTYVVTLEAANAWGTDTVTGTVTVVEQPCVPVTATELSLVSPEPIYVGQPAALSAALLPAGLDTPYNYQVTVDSLVVDSGTEVANPLPFTHTFATTGTHEVKVAIWNCELSPAEAVSDTLTVTVEAGQACIEVQGVTLSVLSAAPLYVDKPVSFAAELDPAGLDLPYNYRIEVDGALAGSGVEMVNPLLFTHTLLATGTHTVEVLVWNCELSPAEAVTGSVTIEAFVNWRTYLPIVLK